MGENFINYAIIGRYADLQETEQAIVRYIQQEAVTR
jgi:hypothetical protein